MPGLVHDAIIPLLVYFKEEIPTSNPSMTLRERRAIMFISGTDVLLFANPATSIITGRGKNVNGVYKQPDAAFKFAGNHGAARNGFPRVVFEVAFSQTYESVLEDARQWLVRAKGAIKLCVIVKLYEQPNRYKEIDYTEIEPKLIEQQLVREMFDAQKTVQAQAASPDASTNNSADSSSTESYDERMDSVAGRALFIHSVDEHAAWVGTLTGFMEFYRLSEDHSGIERDGPRYVRLPAALRMHAQLHPNKPRTSSIPQGRTRYSAFPTYCLPRRSKEILIVPIRFCWQNTVGISILEWRRWRWPASSRRSRLKGRPRGTTPSISIKRRRVTGRRVGGVAMVVIVSGWRPRVSGHDNESLERL